MQSGKVPSLGNRLIYSDRTEIERQNVVKLLLWSRKGTVLSGEICVLFIALSELAKGYNFRSRLLKRVGVLVVLPFIVLSFVSFFLVFVSIKFFPSRKINNISNSWDYPLWKCSRTNFHLSGCQSE